MILAIHSFFRRRIAFIGGLFLIALPVVFFGQFIPGYFTGFEEEEGFHQGPVIETDGWRVEEGEAIISRDAALRGEQALELLPGTPPGSVVWELEGFADSPVVYVDFFFKGVTLPETAIAAATTSGESFQLLLAEAPGNSGVLMAAAGSGWRALTQTRVPVGETGEMLGFIRVTARLDYGRGVWDLHLDGLPAAVNLPLARGGAERFQRFVLRGHPRKSVAIDDFYAGEENPLFDSPMVSTRPGRSLTASSPRRIFVTTTGMAMA